MTGTAWESCPFSWTSWKSAQKIRRDWWERSQRRYDEGEYTTLNIYCYIWSIARFYHIAWELLYYISIISSEQFHYVSAMPSMESYMRVIITFGIYRKRYSVKSSAARISLSAISTLKCWHHASSPHTCSYIILIVVVCICILYIQRHHPCSFSAHKWVGQLQSSAGNSWSYSHQSQATCTNVPPQLYSTDRSVINPSVNLKGKQ